jgi:hypothetical protein
MIRRASNFRLRKTVAVGLMLAVGSFTTLWTTSVLADAAPKAAGELAIMGTVLLNGTQAISGATVFSESTLKTTNGNATVNLGKQGRIELGPNAEMTVRFNGTSIGGNLLAGRATVNAPAGVAVSVATVEGTAVSEGKSAATVTVDVTCGNTRVAAARSDAKLVAKNKVEYVAAGTTASAGQQTQAPRCARLSAATKSEGLSSGALAALIIAGIGGAVAGIIAASQSDDVTPSSIVVSGFRP